MFKDKSAAEQAALLTHGSKIHGGSIIARGPTEQLRRGYSGRYRGKIGYLPTTDNDKRPYTDCFHYVRGVCTNGFNVG